MKMFRKLYSLVCVIFRRIENRAPKDSDIDLHVEMDEDKRAHLYSNYDIKAYNYDVMQD